MKLAIVAYPILESIDREWIESFRSKHDPHASRLGAHFTLVFPFDGLPDDLGPDMAAVAESTEPIPFSIHHTEVVRDALGNGNHIFMVPDEGRAQIATLRDRLYAGRLQTHLRSDIPFVPHMTVGAARDSQSAEALAGQLDVSSRIVRGELRNIELVDVGTRLVRSIKTYVLGNLLAA
jgi:2'-5' RNA ligase